MSLLCCPPLVYRALVLKLFAIVVLTFATSPALAGATPWQDLAPGVRVRLISSDTLVAGSSLAGLELEMPQSTKTYWRFPGEAGIPTQLDFTGSVGVSDPTIGWPYPQIDRSQGYLDYVYYGHVVLPIALKTDGGDATLNAAVTLGVCSEVCVPAQAKFTLPLDFAKPDAGQAIRLGQAEAQVPIAWDQPGDPMGAVAATADGISLANPDPAIERETVIADVGDPAILFETPQKSRDGTLWTLKLLGGATKGLEGRPVRLTFMTAMGPYEVTRQIAAEP